MHYCYIYTAVVPLLCPYIMGHNTSDRIVQEQAYYGSVCPSVYCVCLSVFHTVNTAEKMSLNAGEALPESWKKSLKEVGQTKVWGSPKKGGWTPHWNYVLACVCVCVVCMCVCLCVCVCVCCACKCCVYVLCMHVFSALCFGHVLCAHVFSALCLCCVCTVCLCEHVCIACSCACQHVCVHAYVYAYVSIQVSMHACVSMYVLCMCT